MSDLRADYTRLLHDHHTTKARLDRLEELQRNGGYTLGQMSFFTGYKIKQHGLELNEITAEVLGKVLNKGGIVMPQSQWRAYQ